MPPDDFFIRVIDDFKKFVGFIHNGKKYSEEVANGNIRRILNDFDLVSYNDIYLSFFFIDSIL